MIINHRKRVQISGKTKMLRCKVNLLNSFTNSVWLWWCDVIQWCDIIMMKSCQQYRVHCNHMISLWSWLIFFVNHHTYMFGTCLISFLSYKLCQPQTTCLSGWTIQWYIVVTQLFLGLNISNSFRHLIYSIWLVTYVTWYFFTFVTSPMSLWHHNLHHSNLRWKVSIFSPHLRN